MPPTKPSLKSKWSKSNSFSAFCSSHSSRGTLLPTPESTTYTSNLPKNTHTQGIWSHGKSKLSWDGTTEQRKKGRVDHRAWFYGDEDSLLFWATWLPLKAGLVLRASKGRDLLGAQQSLLFFSPIFVFSPRWKDNLAPLFYLKGELCSIKWSKIMIILILATIWVGIRVGGVWNTRTRNQLSGNLQWKLMGAPRPCAFFSLLCFTKLKAQDVVFYSGIGEENRSRRGAHKAVPHNLDCWEWREHETKVNFHWWHRVEKETGRKEHESRSLAERIFTNHVLLIFPHPWPSTFSGGLFLFFNTGVYWRSGVFLENKKGNPTVAEKERKKAGGREIHLAYQKKFRWLSWPIGHLGNRQRHSQISPRTGQRRRFCGRWRLSPDPPE